MAEKIRFIRIVSKKDPLKLYSMQKQLKMGTLGENILALWAMLCSLDIVGLIDVRNDNAMREKDIDYIALLRDGKCLYLEAKTDTYETGNVFIEVISCKEANTLGWAWKTGAGCVSYIYPITGDTLMIPPENLRSWMEAMGEEEMDRRFSRKNVLNYNDGKSYVSIGYAIPMSVLLEEVPGVRLWNLQKALMLNGDFRILEDFEEAAKFTNEKFEELTTVSPEVFGLQDCVSQDCPVYLSRWGIGDAKRWKEKYELRKKLDKENEEKTPVILPALGIRLKVSSM